MKITKLDVLAIGAHPDDVELGCAGTLAKLARLGYKTGALDLTQGEMASRGSVADRKKEAAESARILNLSFRDNLKFPDAFIENTPEAREKIIRVIRRLRPEVIFAPYPDDRHPDHIRAGNLITEAAFYAGLGKIVPELPAHRPRRIVYYMITYEFVPSFVVDISRDFAVKKKALSAYRSQFFNPDWPGENTFISSQWFLESVEFRARHYGWLSGVEYGEPFYVREMIALDDIMPILTQNRM